MRVDRRTDTSARKISFLALLRWTQLAHSRLWSAVLSLSNLSAQSSQTFIGPGRWWGFVRHLVACVVVALVAVFAGHWNGVKRLNKVSHFSFVLWGWKWCTWLTLYLNQQGCLRCFWLITRKVLCCDQYHSLRCRPACTSSFPKE